MKGGAFLFVVGAVLAAGVSPAPGDLIIFGTQTDYGLVPGGSLSDVQLAVDLSVSSGKATMTFANISGGLETSAVFEQIVIDTVDDDTGLAVLWNPTVVTDTPYVRYDLASYNGLPGYTTVIGSDAGMIQLQAGPPVSRKGIGPGEVLVVQFDTSLGPTDGIDQYLSFFNGGGDTATYSIGFHAVSADVVGGQSLSGVIAEPGAVVLLLIGGAVLGVARRSRSMFWQAG